MGVIAQARDEREVTGPLRKRARHGRRLRSPPSSAPMLRCLLGSRLILNSGTAKTEVADPIAWIARIAVRRA